MLAAREHRHTLFVLLRRKSHSVQDLFDLRIHMIAVGRVHRGGKRRMPLQQSRVAGARLHLVLHALHFRHCVQHGAERVFHLFIHCTVGVEHAVLL